MCGRPISKKNCQSITFDFWTIIKEVSPQLWGVLGGALKKKVTKNGAWGRKKEITVALMRTRASGAISSEL